MEGGHGHEGKVVVSKRMAQIQSGMSIGSGALTMSAAMRMVHEERLAERDINMIRDKGDDPTFFNLSRLTVEGLARSTMKSVLELWGTKCQGGTPLTAETEVGEGTKGNKSKSTCDQTEFSMELGGDTFAMLGHACEKFVEDLAHRSLERARLRRSRVIDVQDVQESVRSEEGPVLDDRADQDMQPKKYIKRGTHSQREGGV